MSRRIVKEYDVYQYDELSPEAQEKARDWFREGIDYDAEVHLWEPINDMLQHDAQEFGYEKVDWTADAWSNFSVLVVGDVDEAEVFSRLGIHDDPSNYAVWISGRLDRPYERQEVHVEAQFDEDGLHPGEESIEAVEYLIRLSVEADVEEVQYRLIDAARAMHDYAYSDEHAEEAIEANEYEFLEDGSPA